MPIIRQRAQEAGTASDVTERATRGARALLPGEIFGQSVPQPSTLWLELAIAYRSTLNDDGDALIPTPGMEEIIPDLLALAGCEPEVRWPILRERRAALVSQPRTPLEQSLIRLLASAGTIVEAQHSSLSIRITSLFQEMPDHEIQLWQPASGAWIKSGSVEVAVLTTPECEITAVELRLSQSMWRLPSVIGKPLIAQFQAQHRHQQRRRRQY
ncbi:hypothetical protein KSF_036500 [Reticulibacter mediterranei]|uniref:Uncharacterized protein n=1 Tax=Reticulibacter mediterranei TaxID=2778369 RepID=A0A8J3N3Y4_9CHLR|nr:hypothetical protein KSF_036500 [Reticulibacter mediterranei]